jgi:hypothetical protein
MSHRRVLAPFAVLAAASALLAIPTPALAQAVCGVDSDQLGNGGFETPGVAPDSFDLYPEDQVPPWHTTDSGGAIEIWGDTFLGTPAFEGGSFAELNANSAGTLYQDVVSTPGATMTWTLHHRGREGTDTMRVLIGDADAADVNSDTGWDASSGDLADDNTAWGTHSDDYLVPAAQTCTRFAFRAVGSSNGDPSYGNLIDAISFVVTAPAAPTPPPAAPTQVPTTPPTDTASGEVGTLSIAAGLFPLGVLAVMGGVTLAVASRRRR